MPSACKCKLSRGRTCKGCSPNSTSRPIPIPAPYSAENEPLPRILQNGNATPGVSLPPRRDITDYTPWQHLKRAQPSTARFEMTDPSRLGQIVPPGFGPKRPPRKDLGLGIVPDRVPAGGNVRELNQWAWENAWRRERVKETGLAARRDMAEETNRRWQARKRGSRRRRSDSVTVAVSVALQSVSPGKQTRGRDGG